jgi:hypothetical protein
MKMAYLYSKKGKKQVSAVGETIAGRNLRTYKVKRFWPQDYWLAIYKRLRAVKKRLRTFIP